VPVEPATISPFGTRPRSRTGSRSTAEKLVARRVPTSSMGPSRFCYAGQMVVVTVWREGSDPTLARYGSGRRLIEAFLAPMCVWPEDARPPFPGC
jgi:hypothetical protein